MKNRTNLIGGIRKNMVYIDYINVASVNEDDYLYLKKFVSKERREKAEKYYFLQDRIRSIYAELLLVYGFYQCYRENLEINIFYNEYGKPYIRSNKKFYYSISHSGDWVVIAYGDTEIGVDVENIHENYDAISNRCFTDIEKEWISKDDTISKNQKMTFIWTLKEAYLKYIGTGLYKSMKTFSIDMKNKNVVDEIGKPTSNIELYSFLISDDYICSVCSDIVQKHKKEVSQSEIKNFVMQRQKK